MALFGDRPLDFFKLYKICELARQDARHKEWASRRQWSRLRGSADSPAATGDDARHAVQKGDPISDPMTLSEARRFIGDVLKKWAAAEA